MKNSATSNIFSTDCSLLVDPYPVQFGLDIKGCKHPMNGFGTMLESEQASTHDKVFEGN
jgi:hypothetical protein